MVLPFADMFTSCLPGFVTTQLSFGRRRMHQLCRELVAGPLHAPECERVNESTRLSCMASAYFVPYTRKTFSPATGLYSPSCRAFTRFSHARFFDAVWNLVSPTNLLWVGLSMIL